MKSATQTETSRCIQCNEICGADAHNEGQDWDGAERWMCDECFRAESGEPEAAVASRWEEDEASLAESDEFGF